MTEPNLPPFKGEEVEVLEAARRGRSRQALILDVREDDEWAAGHLPGALHIPLRQLPSRLGDLDLDRAYLTMCRSGRRSATAAAQLDAAGVQVGNIVGGMQAWQGAGLPVVTDSGEPGKVM